MKYIISTLIFCLLFITSNAQSGTKFEYKAITRFEGVWVTPKFDQSKGQGKEGFAEISDKYYVGNLFYDMIKGVLPKEKLLKVNSNSCFIIYFNTAGDVINCAFSLNPKDTSLISEDDLYILYTKFKKTKIDMNIVKITTGGNDVPSGEKYDYAMIMGSLVPFEYRTDPRLNR